MRTLLFVGIILVCLSCKKDKVLTIQEEAKIAKLDSLSNEKNKIALIKLLPEAEKKIEKLDDFHNLRKLMKSLHVSNAHTISKHTDSVEVLIRVFRRTLDKSLKENNIISRVNVMSTEVGLLKELTIKSAPNSKKIVAANARLTKAYNSLILQLNELSLAIPENIEKELMRK